MIHKGHWPLVFFLRVKGKLVTCWGQHALIDKQINTSLCSLTPWARPRCLKLKMWLRHANVHNNMHEFKRYPDHWSGSPDYKASWMVFAKALFTLCPPYVMLLTVWNRRAVPVGGRCGWGHLIPSMLQGQREEKKEHNWIRYQNKVSVCFNYSSDTGSSWKHREPAERENERKRKRWSKGVMEGEKEKRERKAERAAGVNGPQAVAGAWEQRPEGGAVWEVPGLSEFSVRSPNWVDSGHFHYHNTAQICPKAALLTNPATKGILEERSSREIDSLFVEDYLDFRKIPSCCYCANKHFCKLLEDKKNSWNLRLGMSTLLL